LIVLLSLILISVNGCATNTISGSYCTIYTPVPTLHPDLYPTEEQMLRVDQNNAKLEEC
jgi:hypothetical protein